jgi:hypothetical protein
MQTDRDDARPNNASHRKPGHPSAGEGYPLKQVAAGTPGGLLAMNEYARALRSQADRARFYADVLGQDEAVERLREYSAELDAQADALERLAKADSEVF